MFLIDGQVPIPTGAVEPDWLGWQLQWDQFRLVAISGRPEDQYHREGRERYIAENYAEWFDLSLAESILGTPLPARAHEAPGGHEFLSYEPNFAYRARSAPTLTVRQLQAVGIAYLKKAIPLAPVH